jgi:hypothetical protein
MQTHLVLHGLAIKKLAAPEAIAELIGLPPATVAARLGDAVASGRAIAVDGKYMLSPLAQIALEGDYSLQYSDLREDDAFLAAYEDFERVNIALKALITDWQTVIVGGQPVINDHSDRDHDEKIITRLGAFHDRADAILKRLAKGLPRLEHYRTGLLAALEKAEDGAIEWVSDARIESYHTLWFELHEELLRIVGRQRSE